MDSETFKVEWNAIAPAPRVQPIKPGNYPATITELKPAKAGTGTEGVQINFVITDGDYRGQVLTHHIWVSGAGIRDRETVLSIARRDLAILGFTNFGQVQSPASWPMVDPARRFVLTITRDDSNPIGRIYCFNPL